MVLQDIANWILAQSGITWQLDVDFFYGALPIKDKNGDDVPERSMVLLERTPGAVEGLLPDRVDKAVQVWNRARDYADAAADAEEIYLLLHGEGGFALPPEESGFAWYVMTVDALGSPAPIANPNPRGLVEFSTNYIFRIEGEPPTP
jgi:hypothetical protein